MNLESEEPANSDDGAQVVHPGSVASPVYDRETAEKDCSVQPSRDATASPHIQSRTVGAPPIRWRWWAIGLVSSAAIWFAMFRLFGLI